MCDYYADKLEGKCGPWVDLDHFIIPVRIPVPRHGRLTAKEKRDISFGRQRQKHTKATRKKIARSLKGKPKSKKHKEAIAAKLRGRIIPESTRMKMAMSATTRNFRVVQIPG